MLKSTPPTDNSEAVYIQLQRHLDRQAVGFPATRSGAEIRVLKHIFTPREAALACCLRDRFESLETIAERAGHLVSTPAALEVELGRLLLKGGIESKTQNGGRVYCNSPLVVGMYEFQIGRLTPEFIRDFKQYTSSVKFGLEFLGTKLPQLRTIPVARSLDVRHHASLFDEVEALLEAADGPFLIFECICRKKKAMEGAPCRVTTRQETCLAIGELALPLYRSGVGREISRNEALETLTRNQKDGLVLQPSNTQRADFICSCCGCCCGMLGMHQLLPKPSDFWASNYLVTVAQDTCTGCGACQTRCQVGAVRLRGEANCAVVDPHRCIGCGLCVPTCPTHAICLAKKPVEVIPPPTRESLHDILKTHRKGPAGKLKLSGKLLVDALRAGPGYLLRRE